jgi:hypothetical protein
MPSFFGTQEGDFSLFTAKADLDSRAFAELYRDGQERKGVPRPMSEQSDNNSTASHQRWLGCILAIQLNARRAHQYLTLTLSLGEFWPRELPRIISSRPRLGKPTPGECPGGFPNKPKIGFKQHRATVGSYSSLLSS